TCCLGDECTTDILSGSSEADGLQSANLGCSVQRRKVRIGSDATVRATRPGCRGFGSEATFKPSHYLEATFKPSHYLHRDPGRRSRTVQSPRRVRRRSRWRTAYPTTPNAPSAAAPPSTSIGCTLVVSSKTVTARISRPRLQSNVVALISNAALESNRPAVTGNSPL